MINILKILLDINKIASKFFEIIIFDIYFHNIKNFKKL